MRKYLSKLRVIDNVLSATRFGHVKKFFLRCVHLRSYLHRRNMAHHLLAEGELDRHVRELDEQGYTIVTDLLDESLSQELEKESLVKLDQTKQSGGGNSHKEFWMRLLDQAARQHELNMDSVFVRFSLQEKILRIAASYLGEVPYLCYVFLTLSRDHGKNQWEKSQLWHQDHDDAKMLKFFIYLNDVGDESGPFTFVPKQCSKKVKMSFIPKHVPDDHILKYVRPDEIKKITGKKFSAFMIDTSKCYHMGSRIKGAGTRLAFTVAYNLSIPIYPNPNNWIIINKGISEIERMVLNPY